jgi:hypothetical protein
MDRKFNVTVTRTNAVNGLTYFLEHVSVPAEDERRLRQYAVAQGSILTICEIVNDRRAISEADHEAENGILRKVWNWLRIRLDSIAGHLLQCPSHFTPSGVFEMNCFDKIQIEESAEYQFSTMMQELQDLKEKIEEQWLQIQKELDQLSDQYIEDNLTVEIDF